MLVEAQPPKAGPWHQEHVGSGATPHVSGHGLKRHFRVGRFPKPIKVLLQILLLVPPERGASYEPSLVPGLVGLSLFRSRIAGRGALQGLDTFGASCRLRHHSNSGTVFPMSADVGYECRQTTMAHTKLQNQSMMGYLVASGTGRRHAKPNLTETPPNRAGLSPAPSTTTCGLILAICPLVL